MSTPQFEQRIAAVRRFSRFYTRQLGLLQESLVHTRFSLTEARVLYELAHREQSPQASLPPISISTTAISAASCAASATRAC